MQNILIKNSIVLATIGLLLGLIIANGIHFYQLSMTPLTDIQAKNEEKLPSPQSKIATPQTIVRWHLFGTNIEKQTKVPKSTLRLKLIGIISSTKNSEARVIIEGASRKQKYYKVGDEIKQNVSLESIYPDHIVIMHNSREEIVSLKTLDTKNILIRKVVTQ